jgi:stage II sporulation protein AA (anti-sigma F factor antagonist)
MVSMQVRDGVVVAAVDGEIDLANVEALEEALLDAASQGDVLVVDLTHVTYLDSAALSMIHRLWLTREPAEHDFRLVVADEAFGRRVLAITGLDAVIPVDRTVAEAEARLRGDRPPR